MVLLLSLEGNIGAGKSTIIQKLKEYLPNVRLIEEPVGVWTSLKNNEGENLLELFYKDKRRWGYTFHNCAILSRMKLIQDILDNAHPDDIILTERSVHTDRYVFAEMLHDEGVLDNLEWELYNMWFDSFASKIPLQGIIWTSTSPETSAKRIIKRGRHGEEAIPLEYLKDLDQQHLKWITNTHLKTIEISTEEGVDFEESVLQIKNFINQFIKNKND